MQRAAASLRVSDLRVAPRPPVDFEAKPKELTGRSRSASKDFTEQMKFCGVYLSALRCASQPILLLRPCVWAACRLPPLGLGRGCGLLRAVCGRGAIGVLC